MISRIWKDIKGFDLAFRPQRYFWPLEAGTHLAATVKGSFRRELLADADDPPPPVVADVLARESLSGPMRRALGRIHPLLMSGEYLPDLASREVEIARVTLASVMGDVFSLRARRTPRGIRYRLVDEHDEVFSIRRRYSREPLTMLEVIRQLESARPHSPTLDVIRMNLANGAERDSMEHFVEVSSPFYPELGAWYARYLRRWFDSRFRRGHARRRAPVVPPEQGRLALVRGSEVPADEAGRGGW